MKVIVSRSGVRDNWYILSFGNITVTLQLFIFKGVENITLRDYYRNWVCDNFKDYFEDWFHPTEEEFIAFCLEHDLEY